MTSEALVNFFWPTKFNPDVSLMVRVGRVIHWAFASLALYSFAWGVAHGLDQNDQIHPNLSAYVFGILFLCLVGRGARYILGRE